MSITEYIKIKTWNEENDVQDKFYINMAEAWPLYEMYIKFPKETMSFLKKTI